jgi:hypothetical protein
VKEVFLTVKQQDSSGMQHEITARSGFLHELCSEPKIIELKIVVKEEFNNITE